MTISHLDALVLRSDQVHVVRAFYEAIGFQLVREQHGEGPVHYAADLDGFHFAIYSLPKKAPAPLNDAQHGTMVGFRVSDLDSATQNGLNAGGELEQAIELVPWGRRAILRDPDGRSVELNEAARTGDGS